MPDPQPELETVQHPVLGPLKFPVDMSPDERNESIERALLSSGKAPPSVAAPHQPMMEAPLVGPVPSKPSEAYPDVNNGQPEMREYGNPGASEGRGLREGLSDYGRASVGEMGGGVKDIAQGNVSRGAHRIISGGMAGLTPLAPFGMAAAPVAGLGAISGGYLGGKATRFGAEELGASPDQADLAEDVGNIGGGISGGMIGARGAPLARNAAMEDPDTAAMRGLHIGERSPKMQAKLREVNTARPYLKGAQSQADLQAKVATAKPEVWGPYEKAVNMIGDRTVEGPDGPTTIRALEDERVNLSAQRQAWQSMTPTERQTALQRGQGIDAMDKRYKAITGTLDPALQSTGINPQAIRRVHGSIRGVERQISGKSTIAETKQPYGLRKMIPSFVPGQTGIRGLSWQPFGGMRDIAAGRPWLFGGRPTDINIREGFRTGGPKPNLGASALPPIQGFLPPTRKFWK